MTVEAMAARRSPNDLDTYADDLAAIVEHLGITDAIHLGHSTGGGEVDQEVRCTGVDYARRR